MALSCSKKRSALLRGITSKHHGDFCCLNCPHSFAIENKRESHNKVCEKKDFWNVVMPSENAKISEFNQKSDKAPFIICAEKIDGCKNNPENSSTSKVGEHIPSRFSMSAISSFKNIEIQHDLYRGKDGIKKLCESLREHAIKIINFKIKKNEVINKNLLYL